MTHRSINCQFYLNKYAMARKVVPELFGRTSLFLFEQSVEIRNVVEATVVSNFSNGMCCVN